MTRVVNLFSALLVALSTVQAADVHGDIVIEHKLTKRNVTPTSGLYQRGVAVSLGEDAVSDQLTYERTHVVIYLERATATGAAQPSKSVTTIEQRDRRFVPDLVVIPAGGNITFPNADPVFHNVFSLSKAKEFDLGNYPKGQSRTVTFGKAGIVYVYCHLHPNMVASIVVVPNLWNAIADGEGQFTIANVPPGNYTIVAWHKTAGFFRHNITVTENGVPPVQFVLPLPPDSPSPEHADHSVAHR